LVEIAKERNIDYRPSAEALHALRDYCDRKGLENPLGGSGGPVVNNLVPPIYNPSEALSLPPSAHLPGAGELPNIPHVAPDSHYVPPPVTPGYGQGAYPGMIY
jgi:hypothetical protein